MSQIKVNSIIPVAGVPTGGGGGIIQIKQTVKTDITTGSFSGTNYVDVMTVTITPTSTSSKIFLMTTLSVDCNGNHNATVAQFRRDTTEIFQADASSSRTRCSFALPARLVDYKLPVVHASFLDSPSTTNEITYRLSIFDGNGDGGNYYINRAASTVTSATNVVGCSSLTVMEVSA